MVLRACFVVLTLLLSQQVTTAQVTKEEMYWTWSSTANDTVELSIIENSNRIVGTCCIVFGGGEKIDCSDSDAKNIELQKINSKIFEGSFYSSYFDKKIPVRFVFSENKKN